MSEVYLPELAWENVKSYIFPIDRTSIYTKIRNQYLIGYSCIQRKEKYNKMITRADLERFSNLTCFDDYYVSGLLSFNDYYIIDMYIDIIRKHCVKTDNKNFKYSLWEKIYSFFTDEMIEKIRSKNNGFSRDCEGAFYIAMIYLGFEFKIKNYQMRFKYRIKK